jgi:hypothetical protein
MSSILLRLVRPGILLPILMAAAQGTAAQGSAPALQKGDVIHLDVNLDFYRKDKVTTPLPTDEAGKEGIRVCMPRRSSFEVVDADDAVVTFRRRERWSLSDEQNQALRMTCGPKEGTPELLAINDDPALYAIPRADLKSNYYRHRGITHGALFVPFKRRFDKSLSGESNLGYYLGYRFGGPMGVTITPAGSVGLSIVNVEDDLQVSGSSTLADQGTRPAFTWAAGFILTHLDAFQIGVFIGRDRIGGEVGRAWKFENRTWTSVAFGYAFGR